MSGKFYGTPGFCTLFVLVCGIGGSFLPFFRFRTSYSVDRTGGFRYNDKDFSDPHFHTNIKSEEEEAKWVSRFVGIGTRLVWSQLL